MDIKIKKNSDDLLRNMQLKLSFCDWCISILSSKKSDANHLGGPHRKHKLTSTALKGHGLWSVIGGFRSVLWATKITNPTELSNEFNNNFATIGPELSRNIDSPDGDVYQRYINSTNQCFQLRICDVFNQSVSLGILPDVWKCTRVTPLFKQWDRDDLNNYRPISVISVVAKVFERIVYDQLYAYFRRTRHHL